MKNTLRTALCLLLTLCGEMLHTDGEKAESLSAYLYRLAVLSQRRFNADEMQTFLKESYRILSELSK